jgi:NADH-quinone oxidoreductase subunit N
MIHERYFLAIANRALTVLAPEVILIVTAMVMITAGAFIRLPRRVWCAVSASAMVLALLALRMVWNFTTEPYSSVVLGDVLAGYVRCVFLLTGLVLFALAHDQVDDDRAGEFFGALLLIVAGSMLVAAANELVLLFVGLELVSLPTYLLLYLPRRTTVTQEAATKYFFLSIFSSALLLFGFAYFYGLTGLSNFRALAYVVWRAHDALPVGFGIIAVLFVMAGLGFRVAAVPFHFYAPDVYQGSPTVLTAMLAWIPKAIGFVAMLRALTAVVGGPGAIAERAVLLTWVLAVVTMTLGNTVALVQDDLKRLLAYSSIAHAGYVLIGVAVAFRDAPFTGAGEPPAYLGGEAVLFYLAAYALMTLGFFGVLLLLGAPDRPVVKVEDLAGLARSHPVTALALALCLFSLAGVPPLLGFWGKFQIFTAAFRVADPELKRMFQVLAVIGVINAAIGAYYYLRIVVVMYLRAPDESLSAFRPAWPTMLAVGFCAGLSLLLGLAPEPLHERARQAAVAGVTLDPNPLPLGTPELSRADAK